MIYFDLYGNSDILNGDLNSQYKFCLYKNHWYVFIHIDDLLKLPKIKDIPEEIIKFKIQSEESIQEEVKTENKKWRKINIYYDLETVLTLDNKFEPY